MKFFRFIEKAFRNLLPSPFSIAIILTVLTFTIAFLATEGKSSGFGHVKELLGYWEKGLWDAPNLAFSVQMMLMLVLGHVLALTKPVDTFISHVTQYCNSTASSATIVTSLTVLVALFNWGLGLIFGAILARKVGEHAARKRIPLNYPLIGAAGYSGLMVWHGGISGSAPIKAAENEHVRSLMGGVFNPDQLELLPSSYSFSETIFGSMNLVVMVLLMVLLPFFMYWLGKRSNKVTSLPEIEKFDSSDSESEGLKGAERLDVSRWFALLIGGLIAAYSISTAIDLFPSKGFGFINPNYINLLLLGLGLLLHSSVQSFLKSIDQAIGGSAGILIQFPLYFGILGIMKHSGLVEQMSDFFAQNSTATSFPILTFFSSGLVNIFVPSGGGQWLIQGPVIVKAAMELGVSVPKAIMALSYGDQITNMLQPFWALPLLGITGLKARQILPYTFALMLVGSFIFIAALLIF